METGLTVWGTPEDWEGDGTGGGYIVEYIFSKLIEVYIKNSNHK